MLASSAVDCNREKTIRVEIRQAGKEMSMSGSMLFSLQMMSRCCVGKGINLISSNR